MSRRHLSAERQRNHAAGQRRIVHWCSCGRQLIGNAAWASHRRANPDHTFAGTVRPTP